MRGWWSSTACPVVRLSSGALSGLWRCGGPRLLAGEWPVILCNLGLGFLLKLTRRRRQLQIVIRSSRFGPRPGGARSVAVGMLVEVPSGGSFFRMDVQGRLRRGCCPRPVGRRPLPWLPVRPCFSSFFPPCGGNEGLACDARDGLPADAPEPDFSSHPSGWALMRYSKPFLVTAYAGSALCVYLPSGAVLEWSRCSADVQPWWKTMSCANRVPAGLRCNLLFSGVVCAFVLGQLYWMVPVVCVRVCLYWL